MKTNFSNVACRTTDVGAPGPCVRGQNKSSPSGWRTLIVVAAVLCGLGSSPTAHADLSAPDNVLYGLVVLNSNLVTAAHSDVVIEARRPNGAPVARYRMGARPEAGDFYVLAISVEEMAPVQNSVAVLKNETLQIVVIRDITVQAQASFQVTERGLVQRMDFGTLPLSGFDAWIVENGLGAGSGDLDADGDGFSNLQEYVAGTNPKDRNSQFALVVAQTFNGVEISFSALRAQGVGYANQTRYYTLEAKSDFSSQSEVWAGLGSYSNVVSDAQTIIYLDPATNSLPAFYRGRVELRSP